MAQRQTLLEELVSNGHDPAGGELRALLQRYDELLVEANALRAEQKACSARIGRQRAVGEASTDAQDEMRRVSQQLKSHEAELKDVRVVVAQKLNEVRTASEADASAGHAGKHTECIAATGSGQRHAWHPSEAAAEALEVRECSAPEVWNRFVDAQPHGLLYHRYEWRGIFERVFHHETYYLGARSETEALVGALPAVRLKTPWFGDYVVSLPTLNYGGAIGSQTAQGALMRALGGRADAAGAGHVEFRDRQERRDWPARTDKAAMVKRLPETSEALWRGLSSKLRAQIRRPRKEGAHLEWGGITLLNEFYDVFARNMRALGTPVYPKCFFAEILCTFPGRAHVLVVRFGRQCVASALLLAISDRTLEVPWAASRTDAKRLGTNMLLYWEMLRWATERGYQSFDFGRSSVDSGTYRFKAQWGAEPRQLSWHYWLEPGRQMPNLTPANRQFDFARAIWKRLPLPITRIIGPTIVRGLP